MASYEDKSNHQYLSDNKMDNQQVNVHYNSPPYYSQQQSASPPMSFTYGNHHAVVSPPLTPAVSPVTPILTDSVSGNHPGNSMDHQQYTSYRLSDKSDISYSNGNKYDPFPSYVCYGNSMFTNFGNNNISGSSSSSTSSSITSSAFHSPLAASQSLQQQHKHVCQFNHCGWSFKRYEHLKRHMLVHTGERPHTCHFPGCGKSFSRSDNFHAHYRTHAKKKISRKNSSTKSSVTDDRTCHRGSAFSSLANQSQSQKKLINSSSIASTVAANAAAAVAVSQQLGQNNGVYYNTNLYKQPEMIGYSKSSSAFHTSPTPTLMDFDCLARAQSASSSAASPPTPFLSLLNHESSSSSSSSSSPFYTSPSNIPSYSSFPSYQPYSKKASKGHINNTSNPKSHTCPVSQCMRRFKRLEHLKRHMRIHTLERPFACTYPGCQKNFSRSDNLSQHVKTHQKHEDKRRK